MVCACECKLCVLCVCVSVWVLCVSVCVCVQECYVCCWSLAWGGLRACAWNGLATELKLCAIRYIHIHIYIYAIYRDGGWRVGGRSGHVYLPAASARVACVQNMKHFLWGKTANTVDHRLPLDCTWRQWHSIVCHRTAPAQERKGETEKERERAWVSVLGMAFSTSHLALFLELRVELRRIVSGHACNLLLFLLFGYCCCYCYCCCSCCCCSCSCSCSCCCYCSFCCTHTHKAVYSMLYTW